MARHATQTIGGISVYVPTGESDTRTKRLAPRPASLRGKRLGILDNCKEFADIVLRGVAGVVFLSTRPIRFEVAESCFRSRTAFRLQGR